MKIKLSASQHRLLCEAARRWVSFGNPHSGGETLTTAWTGLGMKSEYKPVTDAGYMVFTHSYAPRCDGWLVLTDKGAAIVKHWLDNKMIRIEDYHVTELPPSVFEM